jgi:hypothetical protein
MTTRILLKNSAIFKGDKIPSSPGLWSAFLIMGALNNLIPVSAILLGVVVLGERLAWNAFAGMGLIFIGLIAIDGRLLKMFKRKEDVSRNPSFSYFSYCVGNPKIYILSRHLIHPLIFQYHQIQSPQPFE